MALLNTIKELKKMRENLYRDATKELNAFIKPVFTSNEDKLPVVLGTCILMKVCERYYLVSAAHVIDQTNVAVFISVNNELKGFAVNGFSTVAPNGKRENDGYDFGWCEIPDEMVIELGRESFLQEDQTSSTCFEENHCIALGYPKSRNKVSIATESVRGGLYPYITKSIYKENDWFVFEYTNVLQDEERGIYDKPLEPDGMSGGALFDLGFLGWERIISWSEGRRLRPRLIGMIIEERYTMRDDKKLREIVTVDIGIIIKAIKAQRFRAKKST